MIHTYKFAEYRHKIVALPLREKMNSCYERSELVNDQFLLFQDGPLSAYYVPFHDMNPKARVAIVGLTPGWTQMEIAFRTVRGRLGGRHGRRGTIPAHFDGEQFCRNHEKESQVCNQFALSLDGGRIVNRARQMRAS